MRDELVVRLGQLLAVGQGAKLHLQFGQKLAGHRAPKEGVFIENFDEREGGIVAIAFVGVGIEVGENVCHALVH